MTANVEHLQGLHQAAWEDYGPIVMSWKTGWLCPFHQDVGRKRITCSQGLRAWFCTGWLLRPEYIAHLTCDEQTGLEGAVSCYLWSDILSRIYWDMKDPELVEHSVASLTETMRERSGWVAWKTELEQRRGIPSHRWALRAPVSCP